MTKWILKFTLFKLTKLQIVYINNFCLFSKRKFKVNKKKKKKFNIAISLNNVVKIHSFTKNIYIYGVVSTSYFCSLQVHRNSTSKSNVSQTFRFIAISSVKFFFFFSFLSSLIFSPTKLRVSITPTDKTKSGKMSMTSL